MATTNKRSAHFMLHAIVGDGDNTEWIFVGVGYRNKGGSMSLLLGRDWQLINKQDGRVLEATEVDGDGGTYAARVKLVARLTKAAKANAA